MGQTFFDKITASPAVLGKFLASLEAMGGPWDDAFHRRYCDACPFQDCPAVCPHEAQRDNPAWWLGMEVREDE